MAADADVSSRGATSAPVAGILHVTVTGVKVHPLPDQESHTEIACLKIADVQGILVLEQIAAIEERQTAQRVEVQF